MKALFIGFSILFVGIGIGSEPDFQNKESVYYWKIFNSKIPQKKSLWKFRDLNEKAVFIVVSGDRSNVFYKRYGSNEEPTKRSVSEFREQFEPIKK